MKKVIFSILLASFYNIAFAQKDTIPVVAKYSAVMIPMRDGVKLYTVIRSPVDITNPQPIYLNRTPYGAISIPPDSVVRSKQKGFIGFYISQDIRGRWKSEGRKQLHQPVIHTTEKGAVDESTDTWDTIDWLIKNLKGHNGRIGMFGTSYGGWLTLAGAIDPHPALKAVIEHAGMADLWLGDDFYHNGAFRLSYGFEYTFMMEADSNFNFGNSDLYDWYFKLGSLKNVNDKYLYNSIPAWNEFVNHPNYDSFWKKNSPLSYMP
ncbi:MAG: CocE/NonD family hydrolase, partial [Saprospiraceae bacterium]|nr:CocE/NonD family hydrolase [Saprospiraceae bacterium]